MNHFNASRQPVQAQRPNTAPGSAEALVRAGQVREAMTLESTKQELSRNYVGAVTS